ncbi:amidohydrolase [Halovulum dunhuangense]|uniref:Amidohydrolase n=1 Tax=Halovulum dunhuangense TaxID=1505036 RepID=A0A849L2Q9_9RHOB|nr:M20 aminoacylase family protein [Halovulum dunhuangense]NNU80481.1 amidohydrolase [Halovulum dunhuangense]
MPVLNRIAQFQEEMTAWRQHIHANPELLFDTVETAAFVAARLREFGVDEVHTGIARNGVVGILRGQGEGPVIGLRADMDALPIEEARDLPYRSQTPGKMHACGHDGHTTMLLGAAKYLAETRNFSGSVALIFQPAEEGGGGARVMLEEGLLERFGISQVYGMHNWPGLPVGRIEMNRGATMAAADQFDIRIRVNGAHAAWPHLSADPIVTGAAIVQSLQSVVARSVDPHQPVVVSVTQFQAGNTHNVIPASAHLKGTVRTMDESVRKDVAARIRRIAESVAEAHGAEVEVDYRWGYPATVNDDRAVSFALDVAGEVVGAGNASEGHSPQMGAEDFGYMLQKRPGAYVFIGNGDSAGLHHPEYDFNDAVSPVGASFLARLVERAQPVAR